MKEFANETPSELLTRLMDNELEQELEHELYDALAVSSELQEEHKYHIAVREALKRDSEAYTPPLATVNSLFNKLGYTPPAPASISGGLIRRSPFISAFFKRAAVPLLLILGVSYGSYTLIENYNSDLVADKSENNVVIHKNSVSVMNSGSEESQVTSANPISDISDNTANPRIPIFSSVSNSDNMQEFLAESKSTKDYNLTDNALLASDDNKTLVIAHSSDIIPNDVKFSLVDLNHSANSFSPLNVDLASSNSKTQYTVYLRNFSNSNTELGSIFGGNTNLLSNINVGILSTFDLLDGLKYGLEFANQNYMVLVSESENNDIFSNENRSLLSVALTGKYNPRVFEVAGFSPFVQGSFGVADFGKYFYRMALGFDYRPFDSNIGLTVGYEMSVLNYSIQNQPYDSQVKGVFFGIDFDF